LEIGVYTGISLINIINNIPNSIGVGVDMWSSYNENNLLENMDNLEIEKSFYKNINTSGLDGRITGIKMDSTTALLNYIRKNETFDFIYVDGSHLLLDCYSDLVLSWEILEIGGILAIDDYYYKMETVLDSPFEAVNHFFKRYTNKYKLLHKGCRVFIQKSTF
jgi:predicted O-methyltransferase YrrM